MTLQVKKKSAQPIHYNQTIILLGEIIFPLISEFGSF